MDMRTRIGFPFLASVVTLLLLAVAGLGTATAGDIYVDINAVGANNGTSWADARTDLQSALAVAGDGDTIYVAQGTYKPTSETDRTISFQLKSGVKLLGGYCPDHVRDPACKTILSGDIGIPGDKSDNSLHVVNGSGVDHTAVMDGFTITAGNADRLDISEGYYGGGMFISYICIDEVCTDGNPTLTNVTFSDNSAMLEGGGLYALSSSLTLTDVTFTGNTAYSEGPNPGDPPRGDGGAIFFWAGAATLTNVTISGNTAGGVGGGICVKNNARATLTHVTISGNMASGSGGGWYFNDENDPYMGPVVRNSILWGNSPDQIDNGRGYEHFSNSVVQGGCPDPDHLDCTNIIDADPMLGTLGDNGGYTQTIPLLFGSSAINVGVDYGVTTDQRGVVRPQGLGFDIGAYEYVDTVPPVVTVPANKTVDATGPAGASVTFAASAMDDVDGQRPVTCTPSSGSTFPVGVTNVTCTAKDASGNEGSASFTVTVRYAPITIVSLTPTPASLWPPNHKMVNVIVTARVSGGSGVTTCRITGATSSEPDSGLGDGDTAGDIGARTGLAISLRAERSGNGPGRIYTLTVSCSNAAGTSAKTTTVTVPHDQGKK
jgi:hypothetical protein